MMGGDVKERKKNVLNSSSLDKVDKMWGIEWCFYNKLVNTQTSLDFPFTVCCAFNCDDNAFFALVKYDLLAF